MRQQRPRGSTTREAVIAGALDVVDEVGVEALTIRAVARVVGAPPMSLYSHFANKDELLDLMYAEISRRLYPDVAQPTWPAELQAVGQHMRKTLLEHPRWTALLARSLKPVPVAGRERVLEMIIASGVAPADALRWLTTVFLVVLGLCLTELRFREPDGASELARGFDRLKREFDSDEAASYPNSRAAFRESGDLDLGAIFDSTLAMLIDGMVRASSPVRTV